MSHRIAPIALFVLVALAPSCGGSPAYVPTSSSKTPGNESSMPLPAPSLQRCTLGCPGATEGTAPRCPFCAKGEGCYCQCDPERGSTYCACK